MIDPVAIEEAITDKTKIIMLLQVTGRTADMDANWSIAFEYALTVVEEAAQVLGEKYKGISAGISGTTKMTSKPPRY